jgi:hypothetical protein
VTNADPITKALRQASRGDLRRIARGAAGRLQDRLLGLGWLAYVPGQSQVLALTVPGEIELRHRI